MEWFRNRIDAKIVIENLASALQRGPTALEPRAISRRSSSSSSLSQPHPEGAIS